MGLLDNLNLSAGANFGGTQGGLLDLLRRSIDQQGSYQPSAGFQPSAQPPAQQASSIAVGGYQMPRIGPQASFTPDPAAIPENAQATQGQMQQQALPPALGGGGSGFLRGLQSIANGGGIISALSGNYNDPKSMAQQNLKAQYEALSPMLGPQKAMLAVMNPEAGKILIAQALEKKQYGFQKMDDGTIVRQDALSGTVEPAYQGTPKAQFGVIGEADGGGKAYGWIDPNKRSVTPYTVTGDSDGRTVTGPDGKLIPIPPGVDAKTFRNEISRANAKAAAGEKTEVQAKSEKFGNKMENAEKNLKAVEGEGTGYLGRILEGAPVVGGTAVTNWAQSEGYQKYKQARDNFITALLRDESGAAIGTAEFQRYEKELFPQPGDSRPVIEQKRQARQIAIDGMKKSAGPGYKSPNYGETSAPPPGGKSVDDLLKKYGG